jgi:hypothetical protein
MFMDVAGAAMLTLATGVGFVTPPPVESLPPPLQAAKANGRAISSARITGVRRMDSLPQGAEKVHRSGKAGMAASPDELCRPVGRTEATPHYSSLHHPHIATGIT